MTRIDVTREDGHIEYLDPVFKPLAVECPRCEAPAGSTCWDLRYRRAVPRRPHAQRLYAGLSYQALTLKLISGRWFVIDDSVPF